MSGLSLFQIEAELLQLMEWRESAASDPEMGDIERDAILEATDKALKEYAERELSKVDGIAMFVRECAKRSEVYREEARRMLGHAQLWESREERLREVVIGVMQFAGKTRVDGRSNVLKLAKCPASVDVRQPDLVPTNLQRRKLTMTQALFEEIYKLLNDGDMDQRGMAFSLLMAAQDSDPEPMKPEIGKRLKAGEAVPGTVLVTDKVRLKID